MYGLFFGFGGNIAACSYDYEWIGVTVRVLDVEPAEEHNSGGNDSLTDLETLAKLHNH
jgi:hypothetical protein